MFERRETEPEKMDSTEFADREAEDSFRFIENVNRFGGGTGVVRRFLKRETLGRERASFRILDLGSGSCDIPLSILPWARRKGLELHFTCLDFNPTAVRLARAKIQKAGEQAVECVEADVFEYSPEEPFDFCLASMFFHHLDDSSILRLVSHLRPCIRKSLLINDLLRSRVSHALCRLLLVGSPHVVRHDAPLSIRRAFVVEELLQLLQQLPDVNVSVHRAPFFRLAAVVRFQLNHSGSCRLSCD